MNKDILFTDVPTEWVNILDNELLDDVLNQLQDIDDMTPPPDKIFEFARLTPLNDIKVVILGQDPYPRKGYAHGLAFSCLETIPSSLKNIYKCLLHWKLIDKYPIVGNLTSWAKRGILLLNCSLTTKINTSNAHKTIWRKYINRLIGTFKHVTFLLWGNDAKKKAKYIHDSSDVLTYAHPSPLAQSRTKFIDCNHFMLMKQKYNIDWNVISDIDIRFDMTDNKTIVFTDGSCFPNKKCKEAIAGYAAAFALGVFNGTVLYGNIDNTKHYASNQRAEGYAIFKTFEFLQSHMDKWESLIIVSDSDFWIRMIEEYMPRWDRQGIDFNEKKNADLTTQIWNVYTELLMHNKEIEFRHIHSHNKDGWKYYGKHTYKHFCWYFNDYADKFAKYARVNLTPGTHKIDEP